MAPSANDRFRSGMRSSRFCSLRSISEPLASGTGAQGMVEREQQGPDGSNVRLALLTRELRGNVVRGPCPMISTRHTPLPSRKAPSSIGLHHSEAIVLPEDQAIQHDEYTLRAFPEGGMLSAVGRTTLLRIATVMNPLVSNEATEARPRRPGPIIDWKKDHCAGVPEWRRVHPDDSAGGNRVPPACNPGSGASDFCEQQPQQVGDFRRPCRPWNGRSGPGSFVRSRSPVEY